MGDAKRNTAQGGGYSWLSLICIMLIGAFAAPPPPPVEEGFCGGGGLGKEMPLCTPSLQVELQPGNMPAACHGCSP